MSYLIDGHNLIPKIPGLNLRRIDDEEELIGLLQEFYRVKRKPVEVYFDRAATGKSGTRSLGTIKAHFVREGLQADDAIIQRVRKAGKAAPEMIVVSSDHRIQHEVRALRGQVMTSEEFSSILVQALRDGASSGSETGEIHQSDAEIEEWIRLFSRKKQVVL